MLDNLKAADGPAELAPRRNVFEGDLKQRFAEAEQVGARGDLDARTGDGERMRRFLAASEQRCCRAIKPEARVMTAISEFQACRAGPRRAGVEVEPGRLPVATCRYQPAVSVAAERDIGT